MVSSGLKSELWDGTAEENGNAESLGIILAINFYYLYELFCICQRTPPIYKM